LFEIDEELTNYKQGMATQEGRITRVGKYETLVALLFCFGPM